MTVLKNNWHLMILAIAILSVSWPLFLPGFFPHHDDLQIMRLFEMRKCFSDGQIPCRWVPDMGYGNGYPLFNYYSAFPYYLGGVLSFVLGYIGATKALFFLTIVISAASMYLLAKELFGKIAGVCASLLYLFAPYKALDLYVRGALAESMALALIPLVFCFVLKLIRSGKVVNFIGTALSLGAFLTSHNIMTLFFLPLYLIWCVYWLITTNKKNWLITVFATVFGLGISAFFLLPAYFEKFLVQSDSLISMDLNFRAHFVTIDQLFFSRNWGYGFDGDGISSQIGWPYWWIAAVVISISIILALVSVKKSKRFFNRDKVFILLFSIMTFCFAVFMTHVRSAFIWERIHILSYVQFPWRFLSVAVFSSSILGGLLVSILKEKWQYLLLFFITVTTVFFNWSYFQPKQFDFEVTDVQKLTGRELERQQKAAILDYLPITSLEPTEKAPSLPIIRSGEGSIKYFDNHSNHWQFQVKVSQSSVIEIPVLDFPNWAVLVNGEAYPHSNKNITGRIQIDLAPGEYIVSGQFHDTPIRRISNLITLISLFAAGGLIYYGKNHKIFN